MGHECSSKKEAKTHAAFIAHRIGTERPSFAKRGNFIAVRDERGAKIFAAPITSTVRSLTSPLAAALTIGSGLSDLARSRCFSTCAYRKSHPAILMVQSAQDRAADDIPGPLNAARDRGILVQ
jgi:hypothetical protein